MNRVLAVILMPAVLLAHWAGIGHCHAGGQPAGHGSRPHLHTGAPHRDGPAHGHHHGHGHHGHDGHHQHHDDGDAGEPDGCPAPAPEPAQDHDADAAYLDSVDAVLGARPVAEGGLGASALLPAPLLALALGPSAAQPRGPAGWALPPPASCPLHVRHLVFLI